MWISVIAITLAIAAGCCIAAIIMQPRPDRPGQAAAVTTGTPPRSRNLWQEDAGEPAVRQAVRTSIGEHLRQLYGDVSHEPIPAHLLALVRRLDDLAPPAVPI